MRPGIKSWIGMLMAGLLLLTGRSLAQFNFVSIDVPCGAFPAGALCPAIGHALATTATGINPGGQIVGAYADGSGVEHGYVYSNGAFTTIDVPGSIVGLSPDVRLQTSVNGINSRGDMVGDYFAPPGAPDAPGCILAFSPPCTRGFLYRQGQFTSVLVPGHLGSVPESINSDGSIYGCLHDQTFGMEMFGFVRSQSGNYKTFRYQTLEAGGGELANTAQSVPVSMNNGATADGTVIVGLYSPANSLSHGYMVENGNFIDYVVAGSMATQIWGINANGDFVGFYRSAPGPAGLHGFLQLAGGSAPIAIDYPNALRTQAFAINSGGAIVGVYLDSSGNEHGFLAVPPAGD